MIAQFVKLLPHEHEDLTLVPQHLCKELGLVAHVCNPVLERRDRQIGLAG